MSRAIVTYAAGAHEELMDVALPTYKEFARRHGYEVLAGSEDDYVGEIGLPPAWSKVYLLLDALKRYDEVVWFDCDLVVVNSSEDFPPLKDDKLHSMVRHFENCSEVPNSGVWRLRRSVGGLGSEDLLHKVLELEVFTNHGWWEQAALLTLMGYAVPPEGSRFSETRCRCVRETKWYKACQFMRLCWNSHPSHRAEHPRIVHCSYPDMPRRLEVMRGLVRDPHYNYPRFDIER